MSNYSTGPRYYNNRTGYGRAFEQFFIRVGMFALSWALVGGLVLLLGWVGKMDTEGRMVGQIQHFDADIDF